MKRKRVLVWWFFSFILALEEVVESSHHEVASWEFDNGLEGWAQASFEEIGAELYVEGGELRGRVQGIPGIVQFHSPLLGVETDRDDRLVVALRMKYGGSRAVHGSVQVRLMDPQNWERDFQSLPKDDASTANIQWITVPFEQPVQADGRFHIVYAHVHRQVAGRLIQLRLAPLTKTTSMQEIEGASELPDAWAAFEIDWVKVVRLPLIEKVEGCINKYFQDIPPLPTVLDRERREEDGVFVHRGGAENGSNAMRTQARWSNDDQHVFYETTFEQESAFRYGTTYNCPRQGLGWRIRIQGRNLGSYSDANEDTKWDTVFVDGQACSDVRMTEEERTIECTLPSMKSSSAVDRVVVKVVQPDHRLLADEKPYLSYAVPAPKLDRPFVSNVAARSVDLSWIPPNTTWDAVTVTGYSVTVLRENVDPYFQAEASQEFISPFEVIQTVVLGNFTTTTLVGLEPATRYLFSVSALVENQRDLSWTEVDLYGRRNAVDGALQSLHSLYSQVVRTLEHDVSISRFDANSTLNHGAVVETSTVGPSRNEHGEGHYGLHLVGDAHIENCNSSSACCDFDADRNCALLCSNIKYVNPEYINLESNNKVSSNDPNSANSLYIGPPEATDFDIATLPQCGSSLRLTGSAARLSGAAWYGRKLNVREGFETSFTFRLSNPSLVCKFMDDVATHCRSRGADGFAFVVQNEGPFALGQGGREMGYGGIRNGVAIEFDTFFNPESEDPYENHVAVLTRGWRKTLNSSHDSELGGSSAPIDLTHGEILVKIVYSPSFDESVLMSDSFQANSFSSYFMTGQLEGEDSERQQGRVEFGEDDLGANLESTFGHRDWEDGLGTLSVFIQDMHSPLFTTVLNIGSTLNLDSGRAWVGFTAATGGSFWQVHDILRWTFESSRESPL